MRDNTARVIPQLGQGIPVRNLIGHVMSKMKNAAAKIIVTAACVTQLFSLFTVSKEHHNVFEVKLFCLFGN